MYNTHICKNCGIDYTPLAHPDRSKYCTLRCQESAARKRKRSREKGVRPDLSRTAATGGMEGVFIPDKERFHPIHLERIARGENPITDAPETYLQSEETTTQEDVLAAIFPAADAIKKQLEKENKK